MKGVIMHKLLRACLLTTTYLSLTACQASPLSDFANIKPGMEKNDVLETMGSPRRTQRFHGKDRWTYVFYDKQIRFEKEVQFFEGNAIYIGDTWQPPEDKSAFAADQANEVKNKALDEQLAQEAIENRSAYQSYEARVKGSSGPQQYVPVFKPVQ
jgi:outer membrane protein assembly factor BamE